MARDEVATMAHGWRRRSSAVGSVLAVLAATSGCRMLPARQPVIAPAVAPSVDPAPVAPPLAALPLVELPELRPIGDAEALSRPPTPILDAAARRDEAIQRAMAEEPAAALAPSSPPSDIPPRPEPQKPVESVQPTSQTSEKSADVAVPSQGVAPDAQAEWSRGLETLKGLARERASQQGETGTVWLARQKILDGLADPNDPTLLKTVLGSLATDPEPVRTEPAPEPPIVEPIRIEPVVAVGPEITAIRLCRKVMGFGKVEPIPLESLRPGRNVLLYCEVDRIGVEEVQGVYQSRMNLTLDILKDLESEPIFTQSFPAEDRCERHRRDFFVGYNVTIPEKLEAGDYQFRLTLDDQVAGSKATRTLPVTIRK